MISTFFHDAGSVFCVLSQRSLWVAAGAFGAIWVAGCTPPTDPVSAIPEMSVGVPVGRSDDPGTLTDAPIEPPLLEGIDAADAKTIAMRFEDPDPETKPGSPGSPGPRRTSIAVESATAGLTLPSEIVVPVDPALLDRMTLPAELLTGPKLSGQNASSAKSSDSKSADSTWMADPSSADDDLQLVQSPVARPNPPPIEIVPTPQPDPDRSSPAMAVPAPSAVSGLELIPTPRGQTDPATTPSGTPQPTPATSNATSNANASKTSAPKTDETRSATATAATVAANATPNTNADGDAVAAVPDRDSVSGTKPAGGAIGFPDGQDGPEDYQTWDTPMVTLVFTGQQHGYIEPCGCTGLDRQKGGVARRFTFLDSIREKGWTVIPMDAGNQVRRFGRQAVTKLQHTAKALDQMDYRAVGFGPDDIRLGVGDLLAVAAEREIFVSANVVLFDPEYLPRIKIVEENGMKIGVTSVLDPASLEVPPDDALSVTDPVDAASAAVAQLAAASPDFRVLLFFGKEEAAKSLMQKVPGFDLIVVAGGYGEPTYQAESIAGSQTRIIVTGDKGMYAGLIALYPADSPSAKSKTAVRLTSGAAMKYARVPLTHEFADAPEMRGVMKDYQDQLRDIGLGGLGLLPPIKHSSGGSFVGSKKCGECHTTAYEIWESSAHFEATEHIVHPPKERGDIARHFDPECISCHVTGWNPQEYYPYESGYLSLEASSHLTGNGCENCHGPGADHSAAEAKDAVVSAALKAELRNAMKLPLENAREKCMTCHDLDNSPDFHEPDAFEDVYWPQVEHYGLD